MLQFPLSVILAAAKQLSNVFREGKTKSLDTIRQLVAYAHQARRAGIISLDEELETIQDPFLKRSLMLAVDGTEPEELRKMMESELNAQAEEEELTARVFESAGGFAPTIGIIGAVLGLIQSTIEQRHHRRHEVCVCDLPCTSVRMGSALLAFQYDDWTSFRHIPGLFAHGRLC